MRIGKLDSQFNWISQLQKDHTNAVSYTLFRYALGMVQKKENSNLVCIIKLLWDPFFRLQDLSIAWDHLYQTDLDRDFYKLWVELSFEGRFGKFSAHFCVTCTWYGWFKKLGQHSTFFQQSFRLVLSPK